MDQLCTHRQAEWERLGQVHAATFTDRLADLRDFHLHGALECVECLYDRRKAEQNAYARRWRTAKRTRRKG